MIWASQYTKLLRDRVRMLNKAPLYSLNSAHGVGSVQYGHPTAIKLTPSVEPIGCKEHGEEENDHRISPKSYPEALKLCRPRRVPRCNHSGTVGSDHLSGVGHQQREQAANACQAHKGNVGTIANCKKSASSAWITLAAIYLSWPLSGSSGLRRLQLQRHHRD